MSVKKPTRVNGTPAAGTEALPGAKELYEMIREAAYYRAEKRGFSPGLEAEDWRAAEAEVLARVHAQQGDD
jgi:hypothetical protein